MKEFNRFHGVYVKRNGQIMDKFGTPLGRCKQKNGYRFVFIKKRKVYIHRLVLETFTKPSTYRNDIYNEVDHIDCDKDNNNLSNLRWVNRKLNLCNRRQVYPVLDEISGMYRFCLAYSPIFEHKDEEVVQDVIDQFYLRYFDKMKTFFDESPRAWLGEEHNAYIRKGIISQSDYRAEIHSSLVLNYELFPVTDAFALKYAELSD